MFIGRTIFTLGLLFLSLSPLARAAEDEKPIVLTEEEREEYYQRICVPGFLEKSSIEPEKREEAAEIRKQFHEFLQDPETFLKPSVDLALDDDADLMIGFFATMKIGIHCGLAKELELAISTRGCSDGIRVHQSVKHHNAYCAEIIHKLNPENPESPGKK